MVVIKGSLSRTDRPLHLSLGTLFRCHTREDNDAHLRGAATRRVRLGPCAGLALLGLPVACIFVASLVGSSLAPSSLASCPYRTALCGACLGRTRPFRSRPFTLLHSSAVGSRPAGCTGSSSCLVAGTQGGRDRSASPTQPAAIRGVSSCGADFVLRAGPDHDLVAVATGGVAPATL